MTLPTVLITGAASGIGRAAVRKFAARGWRCVLLDRDAAGLQRLLDALPSSPHAPHQVCVTDLTHAPDIERLAGQVPPLRALINNAGQSDSRNLPLTGQSYADLDRLLALNLRAPAALVEALEHRLAPGAHIVNVASGAGLRAIPWRGAYSASKAGLIAQSRALARSRPDWCVTVLSPGFVRTELVDGLIAAGRLQTGAALAKVPLGRMADPEEMAAALYFLASPAAAALSGQVLAVDGGSSVYGGSQSLPAATLPPLSFVAALDLTIEGGEGDDTAWLPSPVPAGQGYPACLDLRASQAGPGQRLKAVHASAQAFASRYGQQASLTLVLPAASAHDGPEQAEAAAVRMLVATLACEWGAGQLRINALEVVPGLALHSLAPLVHFVAGAGAQYLTGQTLSVGSAA